MARTENAKLTAASQQYIHDLAADADPAGTLRDLADLRDQRDALVKLVDELRRELRKCGGG